MRKLSMTVEPKAGRIHEIDLIVGSAAVLSADGTETRKYEGEVADTKVQVKLWITGVPGSQYALTVDLPGTANDFSAKYTLAATVQKIEFEA